MQRWKSLAPVEEAPASTEVIHPAAVCACGAALPADSAFCAKCGRPGGGGGAIRAINMPLAIAIAVLALAVGAVAGTLLGGGGDAAAERAEKEAAQLRTT